MKQSNMHAQFFVLAAALLWGTTGSAQAFAPAEATPLAVGALRMAIGGTTLILIAWFNGSFKKEFTVDKRWLFAAAICMAAYQPLFFSGVSQTGIAVGTVLALGSAPVFSGTIELFTGGTLTKKWIGGTLLSILGCVFLFGGQGAVNMDPLGSSMSLGAGLAYAVYVKSSRSLFENVPRDVANGLVFFGSAIILSPILFIGDLSWLASPRGVLPMLHLGLIATALAYTLFAYGLVRIPTPKAVALTLMEPLTAATLGIVVFRESISAVSLFGALLLFCGLIVNSLPEAPKQPPLSPEAQVADDADHSDQVDKKTERDS